MSDQAADAPRKRIDIREFRELGYLQEVNRQVLHPLGLALEVVIEEDGTERLGGVWDMRDDLEGIYFADGTLDPEKTWRLREDWLRRRGARVGALGYMVQEPAPEAEPA